MTYKYAQMPVYTGLTEEKIKEITKQRQDSINQQNLEILQHNQKIENKIKSLNLNTEISSGLMQIFTQEGVNFKHLSFLQETTTDDANYSYDCWHEKVQLCKIYHDNKQEFDDNIEKYDQFKELCHELKTPLEGFDNEYLLIEMENDLEKYDAELKKYNEYCTAVLNSKKMEGIR